MTTQVITPPQSRVKEVLKKYGNKARYFEGEQYIRVDRELILKTLRNTSDKANLSWIYMDEINFSNMNLAKVDFSHSSLFRAKFMLCNLVETNFTSADLTLADFTRSYIKSTIFTEANLHQTKFLHLRGDGLIHW